jgi:predicted nucleic acid-binding protein
MYVFDATPLLNLATVERLLLVDDLSRPRLVPEPVYDEVVTRGIDAGHADARRVERALEADVLEVISVPDTETFDRLQANERLTRTDADVLAAADAREATAVMDEAYGRDVADAEGIDTRGTASLVLRLLEADAIDAGTAQKTIDDMLDAGWYCAPDLYAAIRRTIDDLE